MKHFSKFWIYLVVAMALSLAVACGGGTEPAAPAASEAPTETSETMPEEEHADGEEHTEVPEEVAMADRCGDKTKLAAEINFYKGKLYTCRYFFSYELPKIEGLASRLQETNPITMEMETAFFHD